MSDQVGNPEDRFSHNVAHLVIELTKFGFTGYKIKGFSWVPMVVHINAGSYLDIMSCGVIGIRGEIKGIPLPDNWVMSKQFGHTRWY